MLARLEAAWPAPALQRLALFGDALWALCYLAAAVIGWRERTIAFPPLATVLNVSWEFAFGVVWPPADPTAARVYRLWLVLDVALLGEVFLWGTPPAQLGSAGFRVLLAAGVLAALGAHALAYRALRAPELQAYVINLVMSVCFLHLGLTRPGAPGVSLTVAWLKLLGTGCISIANTLMFLRRRTERPLFFALFATVLALDVTYVVLLSLDHARS